MARKILLQRKYNLTDAPIRSVRQILAAEGEMFTRVWYGEAMFRDTERTERPSTS